MVIQEYSQSDFYMISYYLDIRNNEFSFEMTQLDYDWSQNSLFLIY